MISTGQVVKETILFGTLNIVLPTVDICTDGLLMFDLYKPYAYHPSCFSMNVVVVGLVGLVVKHNWTIVNQTCLNEIPQEQLKYENHPSWATMLLVPFLLNYLAGWYRWYQEDEKRQHTWPACLVPGLYPLLREASIIRELWRNPKRGLAKKRKFEREMSEIEPFLESIPTCLILSYILHNIGRNESNRRGGAMVVLNSNFGSWYFGFSYITSIISASLGMVKVLKVRLPKKILIVEQI